MCLKLSCFPDYWKVSLIVFKNVGERSTAGNYGSVKFLSMVSKIFEKLRKNGPVDNLKECDLFYYQYGFRSSCSTAHFLTVTSDRIARAFGCSTYPKVSTVFDTQVFFTISSL